MNTKEIPDATETKEILEPSDVAKKILTLLEIDTKGDVLKTVIEKFGGSVRELLDLKESNPEAFDEFDNDDLADLLYKYCNIKANIIPSDEILADIDAIFVMSGQLITVVEQWLTFKKLKKRIGVRKESVVSIFPMQMMAKYPTEEQIDICSRSLDQPKDPMNGTKWTEWLWSHLLGSNRYKVSRYLPCVNSSELMQTLFSTISSDLPDRPLNILVITAQPKQHKGVFDDYFKQKHYPHKFFFAKETDESFEKHKAEYFGDTPGMSVRFMLRDLAEEWKHSK